MTIDMSGVQIPCWLMIIGAPLLPKENGMEGFWTLLTHTYIHMYIYIYDICNDHRYRGFEMCWPRNMIWWNMRWFLMISYSYDHSEYLRCHVWGDQTLTLWRLTASTRKWGYDGYDPRIVFFENTMRNPILFYSTWWLIPLSKRLITPVIGRLTLQKSH